MEVGEGTCLKLVFKRASTRQGLAGSSRGFCAQLAGETLYRACAAARQNRRARRSGGGGGEICQLCKKVAERGVGELVGGGEADAGGFAAAVGGDFAFDS